LIVSPICFGISGLGDMPGSFGYSVSVERAAATMRAIFDGPINFIDTARIYGSGRSEERVGAAIRERGGLPAGFVISTKIDRDPDSGVFDAAQARRSLETSLKTLGIDRVDLLYLHDFEHARSLAEATSGDGALGELFRLKEQGLATAVGIAAGKVDMMIPLLRDWDFDAVMTHNRFTLVNRNAEAMLNFARSKGIAVMNAAPYAGGVLAKGSDAYPRYAYQAANDAALAPIRRLEAIAARYRIPLGAAALQFSLRDRRVASTVCGVTRPERIKETLQWARLPIPEAFWQEVASLPFATDDPEATRAEVKN
jgi:D-threo-aldose 1-dehydrogenase